MRRKLTPGFVAGPPLPEKADREIFWDSEQPGLGLVVTATGHRSWCVQYRNRAGKSRRMAPPAPGKLSLFEARSWAKRMIGAVMEGRDPLKEERDARAAAGQAFKLVAEEFLRIEGPKLRSAGDRRKMFERLVYPRLGDKPISEIKRGDVTRLLDFIRDNSGPRTASLTFAYLSKVMRWHEMRDGEFRSPLARGMGGKGSEPRSRTLDDAELAAIWRTADEIASPFARLLQFVLLTATRRNEAVGMTRGELGIDLSKYDQRVSGVGWLIPAGRVKNKVDFLVPLSRKAIEVLDKLPNLGSAVFSHNGVKPLGDVSRPLADLRERSGTQGWSLHDVRRSARTLMSRAGVNPDHAERALNHTIRGVRKHYDWHDFCAEKQAAFEALAAQIERIVTPPAANVLPLRRPVP